MHPVPHELLLNIIDIRGATRDLRSRLIRVDDSIEFFKFGLADPLTTPSHPPRRARRDRVSARPHCGSPSSSPHPIPISSTPHHSRVWAQVGHETRERLRQRLCTKPAARAENAACRTMPSRPSSPPPSSSFSVSPHLALPPLSACACLHTPIRRLPPPASLPSRLAPRPPQDAPAQTPNARGTARLSTSQAQERTYRRHHAFNPSRTRTRKRIAAATPARTHCPPIPCPCPCAPRTPPPDVSGVGGIREDGDRGGDGDATHAPVPLHEAKPHAANAATPPAALSSSEMEQRPAAPRGSFSLHAPASCRLVTTMPDALPCQWQCHARGRKLLLQEAPRVCIPSTCTHSRVWRQVGHEPRASPLAPPLRPLTHITHWYFSARARPPPNPCTPTPLHAKSHAQIRETTPHDASTAVLHPLSRRSARSCVRRPSPEYPSALYHTAPPSWRDARTGGIGVGGCAIPTTAGCTRSMRWGRCQRVRAKAIRAEWVVEVEV